MSLKVSLDNVLPVIHELTERNITKGFDMSDDNRDPLEAVHEISRVVNQLNDTIRAMRTLGMNDGADDIACVQEMIEGLAKEAADGICRETHDLFVDSQRRTGDLMVAVVDSCLNHPNHTD